MHENTFTTCDLSLTPVVRRGGRFYNYESITASGSLNPSQTTIAVWSNVLKEAVLRWGKKLAGAKISRLSRSSHSKAGLLRSCARRTVAKKWPKNQTKAFVLFRPPLSDRKGGRTKLVTAGGFLRHLGFRLPWKKASKNFRLWRLFYSRVVPPSQSGKAQILSLAQLSCSRTHAPRGCSCKVESRDVEVTSGWSNFQMIENY